MIFCDCPDAEENLTDHTLFNHFWSEEQKQNRPLIRYINLR